MNKTYIIAEAGVNHNGDISTAKKMIDVAVKAGADAVKFQTFRAEQLVCQSAKKADYQMETTDSTESQFEMLKKLELSYSDHVELISYCKKKNIQFLSTPFDVDSLKMLDRLGVPLIKIPSGEITNYPLLVAAAKTKKPIILSTGMSNLEEIAEAIHVLKANGGERIVLLHCNTEYPTPMKDVNLRAMDTMRERFHLQVGYSDHTLGIEVPIAAVALGATVIEKHFTIDKKMKGPDHKASLEADQLKAMVAAIRNIEVALGSEEKSATTSEKKNMEVARKSIVAAGDIKKGEKFSENNLTTKRPGNGISPMKWNEILGKTADRDYKKDELIRE